MAIKHLSEIELQEIATDRNNCSAAIIAHHDSCDECQREAEKYTGLFAAIKQQARPAFDFDLADLVVKELPVQQAVSRADKYFVLTIVAAALCLAAGTFYFFRVYVSGIFQSIPPASIYFILTVAVSAVLILSDDIFSGLQKLSKIQDTL